MGIFYLFLICLGVTLVPAGLVMVHPGLGLALGGACMVWGGWHGLKTLGGK